MKVGDTVIFEPNYIENPKFIGTILVVEEDYGNYWRIWFATRSYKKLLCVKETLIRKPIPFRIVLIEKTMSKHIPLGRIAATIQGGFFEIKYKKVHDKIINIDDR